MLEVENLQHFTISDVKRVRNGNATEIPSSVKECAIGKLSNIMSDGEGPCSNPHHTKKVKWYLLLLCPTLHILFRIRGNFTQRDLTLGHLTTHWMYL